MTLAVLDVMFEETTHKGRKPPPLPRDRESDGRRMFANQMRSVWGKK